MGICLRQISSRTAMDDSLVLPAEASPGESPFYNNVLYDATNGLYLGL